MRLERFEMSPNVWNVIKFLLIEVVVSVVLSESYGLWMQTKANRLVRKGEEVRITTSRLVRLLPMDIYAGTSKIMGRLIPTGFSLCVLAFVLMTEFASDVDVERRASGKLVSAYTGRDENGNFLQINLTTLSLAPSLRRSADMMSKCIDLTKEDDLDKGILRILPMTAGGRCLNDSIPGSEPAIESNDICLSIATPTFAISGAVCVDEMNSTIGHMAIQHSYTMLVNKTYDILGNELFSVGANKTGHISGTVLQAIAFDEVVKGGPTNILCRRDGTDGATSTARLKACLLWTDRKTFLMLASPQNGVGKILNNIVQDDSTSIFVGDTIKVAGQQNGIKAIFPYGMPSEAQAIDFLRIVLENLPTGEVFLGGSLSVQGSLPVILRPWVLAPYGIGNTAKGGFRKVLDTGDLEDHTFIVLDIRLFLPLFIAGATGMILAVSYRLFMGRKDGAECCQVPTDLSRALKQCTALDEDNGECAFGVSETTRFKLVRNPDGHKHRYHLSASRTDTAAKYDGGSVGMKREERLSGAQF